MNTLQERLRKLSFCDEAHSSHIYAEAADRIDTLEGAIHSCHPGCARAGCVNEKLREAIEEQRRIIETLKCGMPDDGTTPVIRRIAALERQLDEYKMAAEAEADLADSHKAQRDALLEACNGIVDFVDGPAEGKRLDVFVLRLGKARAAIAAIDKVQP